MSTMPRKQKRTSTIYEDAQKEMSNYQKGYNEAVETQLGKSRIVRKVQEVVTPSLGMTEKEKEGYKTGSSDVKEAMKYQATKSMERTNEMKKDEEQRRKKMKGQ